MSIALVAHVSGSASGGFTTGSIDTTGATLLVANLTYYNVAATGQLTDSKGNTWVPFAVEFHSDTAVRLFYCSNPTVGTGHTFSVNNSQYGSLQVAAFSGVTQLAPLDVTAQSNGSSSSATGGSLTPTNANSLMISGLGWRNSGPSLTGVDSGYTITDTVNPGGVICGSLAYLIQTTATAENPTWTLSGGANWGVTNAVFIAGTATIPTTPAVVSSVNLNMPTTGNFTTSSIDTTGATLIVINQSGYNQVGSISDSKGNTWTALTQRSTGNTYQRMYYCVDPIVGTGHTFTVTGGADGSLQVAAFSGISASGFDVGAGGTGSTVTTGQPGSVTPSANGSLIVSGIALLNAASGTACLAGIDSDFKIIVRDPTTGSSSGTILGALAFLVEQPASAAARNPKWTVTINGDLTWAGQNAVFAASGSATSLGPTAIASLQHMGTTYIVVPGIGPTAIASPQHMGTPYLSDPSIGPAYIPSPRAIGNPSVVGPIYPGAVPSQQRLGTPLVDAIWTLDPTAIASLQSVGTPSVAHVLSVSPAAIASLQRIGTPSMTGGPGALLPRAIASQQSLGIPSLAGGSAVLAVYVGGVPWGGTVLLQGGNDTGAPVTYESQNPPTITSQTLGRWTLNIDLFDTTGNFAPARGQSIVLTEGGAKLFAGCIQSVGRQRLMGTQKSMIYHVLATDKSGICDRRLVKTNTYAAGSPVQSAIIDIVATSLNGEGITYTATSVPATLGNLVSNLVFNYSTVTDAFNQIATLSGTIWYVDTNGVLWFNSFTDLPVAPFGLWDNGTTTSENFRSLLIEETNVGYANIVYAVSNLTVVPGSGSGGGGGSGTGTGTNTETYVMTPGNIGVQVLADGTTVYGINTTQPIGTLYSLTVNGTAQVVVEYSQWSGQQPTSAPQYGPWFWLTNATGVAASLVGAGGLPSGSTVVINYTPYTTNSQATFGEALAPIDPATGATLGGCGSGIYEAAVQVKNISSVADLNAIAAAELAKVSGTPIFATFQTDKPGLAPGQILNINIPNMFLAGTGSGVNFVITSCQGVCSTGPLEFGSRFQWKIVAQTSQDLGNFVQWYANLLQNASNALPVFQFEDASFALAPGTSLSGGTPQVNPYLVKRTGQLVFLYAAAAVAPTNQNLVIQFLVNGTLVPGQVVIPGGSSANTPYSYYFPDTNPLWVFNTATENDVVTIMLSYVVTGPNPTPASGVSAYMRWRM